MKHIWIQNKASDKLIVFFNGWGCDGNQFGHLKSEYHDVLMLFDYKDVELEASLLNDIKRYQEVNIAAWSYGVFMAQSIWEKYQLPKNKAVAINGTTQPIHEQYGIPEAIVTGTLNNLNERNLMKFQRRMLGGSEAWKKFEAFKPQREFFEQKEELAALIEHFRGKVSEDNFYDYALVGSGDLIFTAVNQKAFWVNKSIVKEIETPHFCFYAMDSWDDLIKQE